MARLEEWLPRARRFGAACAQNPAYRPALPLNRKMPASVRMPAFPFVPRLLVREFPRDAGAG
jgi:hypothetical protein